jgi:hypothetical protein
MISKDQSEFGHWLTGFFDGESCFNLNHRFRKGLLKLGFVEAPNYPTCYFKIRAP